MRGLESRERRRVPVVLASVISTLLFAAGASLSNRAFAGDGAGVAARGPTSAGRLVSLAGGAAPIFGAAPATPEDGRATFVYLHGVCGLTSNGCGHFAGAPGWLVCPQARTACAGGGSSWGGSVADKIAVVDDALGRARERWPESARVPVVLVGFSQGAYVAMDIARAQPGRFAGLLLLGADTQHAVSSLRAAGVPRVALACGAYDMMFPRMQSTPPALAPGVTARFASLGRVGHTYVAESGTDDVLTSMLAWVAEGGAPPPASEATAGEVAVRR